MSNDMACSFQAEDAWLYKWTIDMLELIQANMSLSAFGIRHWKRVI